MSINNEASIIFSRRKSIQVEGFVTVLVIYKAIKASSTVNQYKQLLLQGNKSMNYYS